MSDENNYTIWHFLKRCHERGWIYRATTSCPGARAAAPASPSTRSSPRATRSVTHTVGLSSSFPLLDRPGESLLVWTTTPWTLAANVAAAVHPELTYVKVRAGRRAVLRLARARSRHAVRGEHEVVGEVHGRELVGLTYRGPFDELPAAARRRRTG